MADEIRELARLVASFDRRLRALESAPRAPFTSVKGGRVVWNPSNGTGLPNVSIGASFVDPENSVALISVGLLGSVALNATDGRLIVPKLACGWERDPDHTIDANGRPVTASGTYNTMWASYLPIGLLSVLSEFKVYLGAGVTTADARIRITSSPDTQTLHEVTGIAGTTTITGPWGLPTEIADFPPQGQVLTFELQARVASGAGNVAVAPTRPLVNSL